MRRDLAITLAGGGNRAFYQLGLLNRWWPTLEPRVAGLATCSAGACVAVMFLSGRERQAAELWQQRVRGITRNVDWWRVLRGEPPAPHGRIYRETLIEAARGGGLERIRSLPFPVRVLTAAFPRLLPVAAAVPLGLLAYNIEKRLDPRRLHPTFGRLVGFRPVVFDLRDCGTADDLADVVLASSATPPFTPVGLCGGQRLLDGGMVDNVPADLGDGLEGAHRNLVLLTRPYPAGTTGRRAGRLYVAPTRPVPIERWDYTRPHLLEETIAMGEQEAELHREELDRFVAETD